jgi:hypothetical protein
MENNSYKKIYFITLCNFWHSWILSYGRSSFFTFLFFMLKISGNRLGEYNKSCSTFHQESNKIDFAFFWVFYDFLGISQVSANSVYYWSSTFPLRPPDFSTPHNNTLPLHIHPWKEVGSRNAALGRRGAAALANAGEPAALPAGEVAGFDYVLT